MNLTSKKFPGIHSRLLYHLTFATVGKYTCMLKYCLGLLCGFKHTSNYCCKVTSVQKGKKRLVSTSIARDKPEVCSLSKQYTISQTWLPKVI